MADIQFVQQDGTKKNDQKTRKLIRRHVMLGKNQGRTPLPKQPMLQGCAVFRKDEWDGIVQRPTQAVIPRRVGSDLSFLEFADNVALPLMNETLQFCSVTNEKLFALEPCIMLNSAEMAAMCLQSLTCDALHLNVMVFGTQMYMDYIFQQTTLGTRMKSDKTVLRHYGKALSLLRERLADWERQTAEISDMTIISIITLATHALVSGQDESARNHVVGLSKLIGARERRIYSFETKVKQMIEILRCDLHISFATGQAPLFFQDPLVEPAFPLPKTTVPHQPPGLYPCTMSLELTEIWFVLRQFCTTVNEAAVTRNKLSDQVLRNIIASVPYWLLKVSFTHGSTDEAMRLGMLAFCASTLLHFRELRIPFGWLESECRRAMNVLMRSEIQLQDTGVALWYLTIYGLAFSPGAAHKSDELLTLLREAIDLCGLHDWDSVKRTVGRFLWIDLVCDYPAHRLISKALTRKAVPVVAEYVSH